MPSPTSATQLAVSWPHTKGRSMPMAFCRGIELAVPQVDVGAQTPAAPTRTITSLGDVIMGWGRLSMLKSWRFFVRGAVFIVGLCPPTAGGGGVRRGGPARAGCRPRRGLFPELAP